MKQFDRRFYINSGFTMATIIFAVGVSIFSHQIAQHPVLGICVVSAMAVAGITGIWYDYVPPKRKPEGGADE